MSELITLPKVTGTFECDKHRTISLISHAAKIALEVIRLRVNHFIAPQIAEEQFGFVSGKGTTDAIIVLRNIIEKESCEAERSKTMDIVCGLCKSI